MSVDGAAATKVAVRVRTGQAVAVALPGMRRRLRPAPESLPLEVLYEDADVIAVNKPAGRVVHPSYRNQDGSPQRSHRVCRSRRRSPATPSTSRQGHVGHCPRGEIGCCGRRVRARARGAVGVEALSRARPRTRGRGAQAGSILPLARHLMDRRRVVVDARRGRPSVTVFIRLGRARPPAPPVSLLDCRLVTGRTHQIACIWCRPGLADCRRRHVRREETREDGSRRRRAGGGELPAASAARLATGADPPVHRPEAIGDVPDADSDLRGLLVAVGDSRYLCRRTVQSRSGRRAEPGLTPAGV